LSETRQKHNLELTEGLQLLLRAELKSSQNRRSGRLTQQTRFQYHASLSEITYSQNRNLDKTQMVSLAGYSFRDKGQSVIITGATGFGKCFLASVGFGVSSFHTMP
jgi:DNA replication protein DnaC